MAAAALSESTPVVIGIRTRWVLAASDSLDSPARSDPITIAIFSVTGIAPMSSASADGVSAHTVNPLAVSSRSSSAR